MSYTSGRYELKVGKTLTPGQKAGVAEEHYAHWFEKADGFFDEHDFYIRKGRFSLAAFLLHQSAETAYKALLLVHTNYCPHDHFLESMGRHTREALPGMEEIFPCKTKKAEDPKTAISRIENHAEDIKLSTLQRFAQALGKKLEINVA